MYDAAIIGTGVAGISAALTLQSRGKSILLIGKKDLSQKMRRAEKIRNYPGLGIVSGEEMVASFSKHLQEMNIGITDKHVTEISKVGDHYQILCGAETFEAYSVILAIGVANTQSYPNEEMLLGKGVSYCATCDGFLYAGKPIAVVCTSKDFESEIEYLSQVASHVYLVANYKDPKEFGKKVTVISGKNLKICGTDHVNGIVASNQEMAVNAVFILRDAIAPTAMIKGIGVDGTHIRVARDCSTDIAGCYAAGDCTGRPYQYAKAAGEGNVAAHSVLEYLSANGFTGNAKTRPYKQYPLSFLDAVEVTDLSGLPTDEMIHRLVKYNLTKGEVVYEKKDIAENGDVIYFSARGGKGRFNKDHLRLTLGQNLYDYDVEKMMVGLEVGSQFTITKNSDIVTIIISEICKPVSVDPTDDMVKEMDPNLSGLQDYFEKIKAETENSELNLIAGNVLRELFDQEPDPETSDEIVETLGNLEVEFFDEFFKKEKGKGLHEMTPEEMKEALGVSSAEEFMTLRKDWYKTKYKQVLVLSKALDIPLEGEYDFMKNYQALGLLSMQAVERIRKIIFKKEDERA